jgi:hypothetical protein
MPEQFLDRADPAAWEEEQTPYDDVASAEGA